MATDLIRYDLLVQDALRGVVRTVLADAAKNGLPGDHHFFITFKTTAPGLRLSDRMRERYPEEMTIILQHQFWDLGVTDHAFEVGLSFSNKPERLLVPFAAITTFHDPSVQFGLKFDAVEETAGDDAETVPEPAKPAAGKPMLTAVEKVPAPESSVATLPTPTKSAEKPARPALAKVPASEPAQDKDKDKEKGKDGEKGKDAGGEPQKVVSIDAFRKKP